LLIRKAKIAGERAQGGARGIETYTAADGTGLLAIRDGERAGSPDEIEVQPLFASGRVGSAGGPWLFHVGLWTPAEFRDEFLAWYAVEHLPILLECRVWDGCRFVEQKVAEGCQFYALHQMSDRAALESEERKVSRSTAWFLRLKARPWFDERFVRALYRRTGAA
jgi:hypothetical protein